MIRRVYCPDCYYYDAPLLACRQGPIAQKKGPHDWCGQGYPEFELDPKEARLYKGMMVTIHRNVGKMLDETESFDEMKPRLSAWFTNATKLLEETSGETPEPKVQPEPRTVLRLGPNPTPSNVSELPDFPGLSPELAERAREFQRTRQQGHPVEPAATKAAFPRYLVNIKLSENDHSPRECENVNDRPREYHVRDMNDLQRQLVVLARDVAVPLGNAANDGVDLDRVYHRRAVFSFVATDSEGGDDLDPTREGTCSFEFDREGYHRFQYDAWWEDEIDG